MKPMKQVDGGEFRREFGREFDNVRQLLHDLPQREPNPDLRMRLRVMASHESSRQRARATWYQRCRSWLIDFRLFADNLMRPLAIPTAGGFLSALLMFGVLAPTLATPIAVAVGQDVPTALYTDAYVQFYSPLGFRNIDVPVEVTISPEGRVIEFSIPSEYRVSPELQRSIANTLLFTQFVPVRNFGQPVTAKIRTWIQDRQIDVRG
jgi:hypothetical protein